MSCDVAVSAALFFASFSPNHGPAPMLIPAVAEATGKNPLLKEPLFAEIVRRAGGLEREVNGFRKAKTLPPQDAFKAKVGELSDLDMKGHLELAARGTDGDLKCILRGISQDLPKKLDDVFAAKDARSRDLALSEMAYLLNDNVGVISAPPAPPV